MFALSADEWQALALSLRVATLSVIVSMPFALALAWLLSRRRFPGMRSILASQEVSRQTR